SQWIISDVSVEVPRLRVFSVLIRKGEIGCYEPSQPVGVVPGPEVVKSGFRIPFFTGKFVAIREDAWCAECLELDVVVIDGSRAGIVDQVNADFSRGVRRVGKRYLLPALSGRKCRCALYVGSCGVVQPQVGLRRGSGIGPYPNGDLIRCARHQTA